jgi:hypothetical protein
MLAFSSQGTRRSSARRCSRQALTALGGYAVTPFLEKIYPEQPFIMKNISLKTKKLNPPPRPSHRMFSKTMDTSCNSNSLQQLKANSVS